MLETRTSRSRVDPIGRRAQDGSVDLAESTQRLDERRTEVGTEVERLVGDLGSWAAGEPRARALGLVRSWARGTATAESDLDLVLLSDQSTCYTTSTGWLDVLGQPPIVRKEQFGVITERRVRLPSGLHVEFGIGPLSWASTAPVDPGTRRVVSEGLLILHDPDGLLARLQAAVLGVECPVLLPGCVQGSRPPLPRNSGQQPGSPALAGPRSSNSGAAQAVVTIARARPLPGLPSGPPRRRRRCRAGAPRARSGGGCRGR